MSGPSVVARTPGVTGGELVLRRATSSRGDVHWEVIANGVFLMDDRDGRSERALVSSAVARAATLDHVVVAGLGLGTSLGTAVADPRPSRITVLEHEPALVAWHHDHLRDLTGAALDDPRVDVVVADAVSWVQGQPAATVDVLCLDVDNGPDWLVTEANGWLYRDDGVAACVRLLRPGGVLAHWSAAPSEALATTMRRHLADVEVAAFPHDRGEPDVVLTGHMP